MRFLSVLGFVLRGKVCTQIRLLNQMCCHLNFLVDYIEAISIGRFNSLLRLF